ncbi:MAG: prepilin-type N-terminal cleavage/methylation domain-containing protein [Thermodesulfovibrionales bacterium]
MNNNRGATLVELMIAMIIILIVSIGFFSWLSTVTRMNLSIERNNTAYAMANDVADRLQRMNDNSLIQPRSGSSRCVGFDVSANLRGCNTAATPPLTCTGGTPQVPLSSNATGLTILTNPNVTSGTLYLYDNNLCAGQMWSDCRGSLTAASNINTANGNIDHPNAISSAYDSINPIRSYKGTTYYAVWSVAYMPCNAGTNTDRRKIFITVYWIDPEPTATTAAAALSGAAIKSVSLVADKTIGAET